MINRENRNDYLYATRENSYEQLNLSSNLSIQERIKSIGLDKITFYLDQFFRIPGTNIRFGLDPIIGFFFPMAGDTVTTLMSIYIVLRSIQFGLPKIVIGRMMFNVALDYLVGSISIFGDLFDFGFKANSKNLKLLERFAKPDARANWTDWLWMFMLIGLLVSAIAFWLWFIFWLFQSVNNSLYG
ncbi:MAG: DUF4112 domain-containing protein [Acidobacteriota bacterium]